MAFPNLRELLEFQVQRFPDKVFLAFFKDGQEFTYSKLNRQVNQIANLFLGLGIRKGQTVSLLLPNIPAFVLCYFACIKIGAVAGPVDFHLKSEELQYILEHSEAHTLVTTTQYLPLVEAVRHKLPQLTTVLLTDGIHSEAIYLPQAISKQGSDLAPMALDWDDEAVIIYTSGTTGKPKGCLLTHGNFLCNAREISEWLNFTEEDRLLCIMPLFHVNGIVATMFTPLYIGGSMVLAEKFTTHRFWEIIDRHKVTSFGSVATMLSMLNHTQYAHGYLESLDTTSLRFALCGSAPVPVEVMHEFEKKYKCPVIEGYGLSEATCRVTFNPPDQRRRPGSIGLPIGCQVRIADENDHQVPVGQIGEILVRGGSIMKGYHKNPHATSAALLGGWLHTGDLGYQDQDGFLYVVDRKADMIIRGGENIYPREIENVFYNHPKILEAATIGIPDELYGEEVKTFAVLRKGQQATEQELLSYCRERLADFKCPKSIEFLEEMPKGPTGKILKRELVNRSRRHRNPH